MLKKRSLNLCVELLTYVWIKWIINYEKSNDSNLNIKERRKSADRCEKIQKIRYKIIKQINDIFEDKIKKL